MSQPTRLTVWTFLNSSFAIFLMSSLVVTGLGAIFSRRSQEAQEIIERRRTEFAILAELDVRVTELASVSADSLAQRRLAYIQGFTGPPDVPPHEETRASSVQEEKEDQLEDEEAQAVAKIVRGTEGACVPSPYDFCRTHLLVLLDRMDQLMSDRLSQEPLDVLVSVVTMKGTTVVRKKRVASARGITEALESDRLLSEIGDSALQNPDTDAVLRSYIWVRRMQVDQCEVIPGLISADNAQGRAKCMKKALESAYEPVG